MVDLRERRSGIWIYMLLICDTRCLLEIGLLLPSLSQTASVVFPIKVSDFSASCQVANVISHLSTEIWRGIPWLEVLTQQRISFQTHIYCGDRCIVSSCMIGFRCSSISMHHRDIRKVGLGGEEQYPPSIPNPSLSRAITNPTPPQLHPPHPR